MRNLLFISIFAIGALCAACGGKCDAVSDTDSTVDTVVVDSAGDTTAVDTAITDSVA